MPLFNVIFDWNKLQTKLYHFFVVVDIRKILYYSGSQQQLQFHYCSSFITEALLLKSS